MSDDLGSVDVDLLKETLEGEAGPPLTNRELLALIADELAMDDQLDEPASVLDVLDMGAIHDETGGFSKGYFLMLQWIADTQEERKKAELEGKVVDLWKWKQERS